MTSTPTGFRNLGGAVLLLVPLISFLSTGLQASQRWNGKTIFFGDTHIHTCLSWDADREPDEQFGSLLYDYDGDFAILSEHAEGPKRFCDGQDLTKGSPGGVIHNSVVPGVMKAAADRWNGRTREHPRFGTLRLVTFPGYEWAPEPECSVDLTDHQNTNDYTPGHINYFFDDTSGWSYGPDVWEPGPQNSTVCKFGSGIGGHSYRGDRDYYDEILGQLIHQRDDPERDYRMLIQANHPAVTTDGGGRDDSVFKWGRYGGNLPSFCRAGPGPEADCLLAEEEMRVEGDRTRYGLYGVEWYAQHEASLGSILNHSSSFHDQYHRPHDWVVSRGLREGFALATTGGGDTHSGSRSMPSGEGDRGAGGRSLTAVYAAEPARQYIFDGLAKKRTYALSRKQGIGPVHKGRVDFFAEDSMTGNYIEGLGGLAKAGGSVGSFFGRFVDFTVLAASEVGATAVYPEEVRIYRVRPDTLLSANTAAPDFWLDDLNDDNDSGKFGELLGVLENPAGELEVTFELANIRVLPQEAIFAVVRYSDETWVDDFYAQDGEPLDDNGDGQPDPGKSPKLHTDNNTWARTTPIWFEKADQIAVRDGSCARLSFAGSGQTSTRSGRGSDAGLGGDDEVLAVGNVPGPGFEYASWDFELRGWSNFVDLSFFTESDEDDLGHLFAVRIDGELVYSGRAGRDHPADTDVELTDIRLLLRPGLHRLEIHMDDQECVGDGPGCEDNPDFHADDYDGPYGYLDAVRFHRVAGPGCDGGQPPTIQCPAAVTVECSVHNGVPQSHPTVQDFLDDYLATDPDPGTVFVTHDAPSFLPLGPTVVTFTATDLDDERVHCTSTVTVHDTRAPSIVPLAPKGSTTLLAPPTWDLTPSVLTPVDGHLDGRLVDIDVPPFRVQDICDPAPLAYCSVKSSEPANIPGPSDGDTDVDIVFNGFPATGQSTGGRVNGGFALQLRAERDLRRIGLGRVYDARCVAVDNQGLTSVPLASSVGVPLRER